MLKPQHVSEITFIRYSQHQKMVKPNTSNLKVFVTKKTKEPKQDCLNRLHLTMHFLNHIKDEIKMKGYGG